MIGSRIAGLALVGIVAALPLGCGDDDDDEQAAAQNCAPIAEPCARCQCQACPCDSACQSGVLAFQNCVQGCLTQDAGNLIACLDGCAAQTTGTAQSYVRCSQSAVSGGCASVCR
jgi:hypothetical protein